MEIKDFLYTLSSAQKKAICAALKPADIILYRTSGIPALDHAGFLISNDKSREALFSGVKTVDVHDQLDNRAAAVVFRNNKFSQAQIAALVQRAISIYGDYDMTGYYGQWADFFYWLATGKESDIFTSRLQSDSDIYCSELVALICDGTVKVSEKPAKLTAPHDLYNCLSKSPDFSRVIQAGVPMWVNPGVDRIRLFPGSA